MGWRLYRKKRFLGVVAGDLLLLDGINEFFGGVPHELQIDLADLLSLLDPSLDCK